MTVAALLNARESYQRGGALKLRRGATFGEVSNAPFEPRSRANPPNANAGASLAINYLTLSGAADSARKGTRGGARNRADRTSKALTEAQVASLIASRLHADAIGLPLNRMITILWETAGVPLALNAKATGKFIDLLSKAIKRRRRRTAYIWVHENGASKGGHCHLLAHVPADLVKYVSGRQRGWLRRVTGNPYRDGVIYSEPIGGRLRMEIGNPGLHALNLQTVLGYVLKGADDQAVASFNLDRVKPGGRVIGKRCGTSQNIGAKARNAKD